MLSKKRPTASGKDFRYLRTGPARGWIMSADTYAKCPACGYYLCLDPTRDETCPCGNLQKDAGAARFSVHTGDSSVKLYKKRSK